MTTTNSDQIDGRTPKSSSARRYRFGPLLGAGAALLVVLVSRAVTSNVTLFPNVTQHSCQGLICVERVSSPDLLIMAGSRRVRVVTLDANGQVLPRMLTENDPFDDYAQVSIGWKDGGVSLSDTAAVLSWDADSLARLND